MKREEEEKKRNELAVGLFVYLLIVGETKTSKSKKKRV